MRAALTVKGVTGDTADHAPVDPHDPDLVAYWNFDEGAGGAVWT